ncbi:MAG: hypothetical protein HAW67_07095 [Endozoicomonadaceae bacterium]|nr:hypothetical protein [Endozoicomonadaceae bacterium]
MKNYDVYRKEQGDIIGCVDSKGYPILKSSDAFIYLIDQIRRGKNDNTSKLVVVEHKKLPNNILDSSELLTITFEQLFNNKKQLIKRRRRLAKDIKLKILGLNEKGFSLRQIGKQLAVSHTYVRNTVITNNNQALNS